MAEEMTTATTTTDATATDTSAAATPAQADTNADTQQADKPLTAEAIEKIVQSRVDKITAELGKKNANLQKELDKAKKDAMSAEELQKYELEQEKTALAEQRKELVDKANRLTAINELTKIELYDGSETATALLDMVVSGANEDADIVNNVKAIKSVVDKLVAAQVNKTFKDNGRVPNGGDKGGAEAKEDNKNNFAAELGKKAAERAKSSNEILNYYYQGGKK